MIICFDCDHDTKAILDKLVESERYFDYGEAITSAIKNLAILQDEIGEKGFLIIENSEVEDEKRLPSAKGSLSKQNKKNASSLLDSKSRRRSLTVPSLFTIHGLENPEEDFANLPIDSFVIGQDIPLDRWIFGQFNRLLPAKVSCRGLAYLLSENPRGVEISYAAQKISEEASILGDYLRELDLKLNNDRDETLAIAFPGMGTEQIKSRFRYSNQFVASVNKQGQVSGLLIDLKLINRQQGKKIVLNITKPGWDFLQLKNPILDHEDEEPYDKFNDEEISYLLQHIATKVPVEDFAYRTILSIVTDGINTPKQIDDELKKHVKQSNGKNFSQSFLSSQRSGAISRMSDLGLIQRNREGNKVSYTISSRGKKYLESSFIREG